MAEKLLDYVVEAEVPYQVPEIPNSIDGALALVERLEDLQNLSDEVENTDKDMTAAYLLCGFFDKVDGEKEEFNVTVLKNYISSDSWKWLRNLAETDTTFLDGIKSFIIPSLTKLKELVKSGKTDEAKQTYKKIKDLLIGYEEYKDYLESEKNKELEQAQEELRRAIEFINGVETVETAVNTYRDVVSDELEWTGENGREILQEEIKKSSVSSKLSALLSSLEQEFPDSIDFYDLFYEFRNRGK